VVEQGSIYEVFSNPQTAVAQSFVATALRNTPDQVEADDLLAYDGRLFTVALAEDSGFFGAAADARAAGVSISIVHGGVTTLQKQCFGKMTLSPDGPESAIQHFYDTLNATTDIQEITR